MDQEFWAVAQTVPNGETRAAAKLRDLGHKVVLPMIKRSHVVKGQRKIIETPVFSSYIFFQFVDSWMDVLGQERLEDGRAADGTLIKRLVAAPETHVVRVLLAESPAEEKLPPTPAIVPTKYIRELQSLLDQHGGYYPAPVKRKFLSGQRVHVSGDESAPFYGRYGTYENQPGNALARVLMDMLGRKVPVVLNEGDLVAA